MQQQEQPNWIQWMKKNGYTSPLLCDVTNSATVVPEYTPRRISVQCMKERDESYALMRMMSSTDGTNKRTNLLLSELGYRFPWSRLLFDLDLFVPVTDAEDTEVRKADLYKQWKAQVPVFYETIVRAASRVINVPSWLALAACRASVSIRDKDGVGKCYTFGIHVWFPYVLLPHGKQSIRHHLVRALKHMLAPNGAYAFSWYGMEASEECNAIDWSKTSQGCLRPPGQQLESDALDFYAVQWELNDPFRQRAGASADKYHSEVIMVERGNTMESNFEAWKKNTKVPEPHLSDWSILPSEKQMLSMCRELANPNSVDTQQSNRATWASAAALDALQGTRKEDNANVRTYLLRRKLLGEIDEGNVTLPATMRQWLKTNKPQPIAFWSTGTLLRCGDTRLIRLLFGKHTGRKELLAAVFAFDSDSAREQYCGLLRFGEDSDLKLVMHLHIGKLDNENLTPPIGARIHHNRRKVAVMDAPASLLLVDGGTIVKWSNTQNAKHGDGWANGDRASALAGEVELDLTPQKAVDLAFDLARYDGERGRVRTMQVDPVDHNSNRKHFADPDTINARMQEEHQVNLLGDGPDNALTLNNVSGPCGAGKDYLSVNTLAQAAMAGKQVEASAPSIALVAAIHDDLADVPELMGRVTHYRVGDDKYDRAQRSAMPVLACTTQSSYKYERENDVLMIDESGKVFSDIGNSYQDRWRVPMFASLVVTLSTLSALFMLDADGDLIASVLFPILLLANKAVRTKLPIREVNVMTLRNTHFNAVKEQRREAFIDFRIDKVMKRAGSLLAEGKHIAMFSSSQRKISDVIDMIHKACPNGTEARILVVQGKRHTTSTQVDANRVYTAEDRVYYYTDRAKDSIDSHNDSMNLAEQLHMLKINVLLYTTAMSHGVSVSADKYRVDEVFVLNFSLPTRTAVGDMRLQSIVPLLLEDYHQAIERVRDFKRLTVYVQKGVFHQWTSGTYRYVLDIGRGDISVNELIREIESLQPGTADAAHWQRVIDQEAYMYEHTMNVAVNDPAILSRLLQFVKRSAFWSNANDSLTAMLLAQGYEVRRRHETTKQAKKNTKEEDEFRKQWEISAERNHVHDTVMQCYLTGISEDMQRIAQDFGIDDRVTQVVGDAEKQSIVRAPSLITFFCNRDERTDESIIDFYHCSEIIGAVSSNVHQRPWLSYRKLIQHVHQRYGIDESLALLQLRGALRPALAAELVYYWLRLCGWRRGPFGYIHEQLHEVSLGSNHDKTYPSSLVYGDSPVSEAVNAVEFIRISLKLLMDPSARRKHKNNEEDGKVSLPTNVVELESIIERVSTGTEKERKRVRACLCKLVIARVLPRHMGIVGVRGTKLLFNLTGEPQRYLSLYSMWHRHGGSQCSARPLQRRQALHPTWTLRFTGNAEKTIHQWIEESNSVQRTIERDAAQFKRAEDRQAHLDDVIGLAEEPDNREEDNVSHDSLKMYNKKTKWSPERGVVARKRKRVPGNVDVQVQNEARAAAEHKRRREDAPSLTPMEIE